MDISIENPAGSRRRPEWPPLKHHYGYFRGSIGRDKDAVDVFLTNNAEDTALPVFVIDQVTKSGRFDEAKVIMGAATEAEARETYLSNYAKGWTGLGGITQMTQEQFKAWVKDPAQTMKRASAAVDRRADAATRAAVEALPVDARDAEITRLRAELDDANKRADTDIRTGLKNPAAFDRDVASAAAVATIDLRQFKGYNTLLTDKGGDKVLAAFGQAMRDVGGEQAYRRGGDEFAFLAESTEAAQGLVDALQARVDQIVLKLRAKGQAYTVTGVPFAAGVGSDEDAAIAARDAGKGDYDRNALPPNVRADQVRGDAGRVPGAAPGREARGRPLTAESVESARAKDDDEFYVAQNVALFSKAGRAGSDRAEWGDFPATVIGHPFGAEQRRLSSHPDYVAAKAGDDEAAARLVDDFVTDEVVTKFRDLVGDRTPVVVPVMALEATGANKIPNAFAVALARRLGLTVSDDIIQAARAFHTSAGAYHRIAFQPTFDGAVEAGEDYLLVDDAVTIGGTLANLRGHIEANGGNVIGAGVLTGHPNSANMAIQDATAAHLQKEFGDGLESYLQDEFGFGVRQLTEGEAGHIRAARTLDELRNRIAAARAQAFDRLSPGAAFSKRGTDEGGGRAAPEQQASTERARQESVRNEVTNGPPKAGRSTSGGISFDLALKLKKELTAKWGDNSPNVILVQNAEDFPTSAKTDPDYRRGEGFYEGKQTVWINVGRIRSSQRFAQVLAHEAIGHFGVERIVGEAQWDGIVDTIERLAQTRGGSAQTRAVIAEVRARYPDADRVTFAKEAIAVMAEKGIRNSIVERVVAAVRRWLRSAMPSMPWKELDVRALLAQSDSFLRVGQAREQSVRTVQAYSFARGGVMAKVDGRGQRTIEMGGETFADRSGKFYMINGTGQPKDIRSLGEATELAKRTGGDVLVDDAIEGERPSWSVVVPDVVARDAFSKRALFSKTSEVVANGEHTSGPDPTRPFAPTLNLNDLPLDKRPLSYAVKGGLDFLKKNAWLPMMPANYLLDYARPGQMQPARFMAVKDEMDSLRGELHAETNEHAQKWLDYHIANRNESPAVMDLMHDSTLAGTDPSADYAPLQFRYSGKDWPATAANVKNALKAINEQIRGRAGDKKGAMYETRDAIKSMGEAEKTRPAKHKALQERFNQLSDAGKELFTSTRDTYKERDELLVKTLLEGIEKEMEHAVTRADRTHEKLLKSFEDQGLKGAELATSKKRAADKHLKDQSISRQKRAARLKEMRETMESNRIQGYWVPLARFGDYFVTVRDATKKVVGFSKFESSGDQQWYADQLAKKYPELRVETGLMSNKDQVRGAVDAGFVADIEEMLDGQGASAEMLDGVWQRYLESLPDFSIRKQFIHRKGTPGYQQDALRAFGSTMFHSAHQIAKLKHGSDLTAAVDLMRDEAKDMDDPTQAGMLANEFEHRLKWVMNPTGGTTAQKITSTAFVWNLAISPAAAAVNWTQTPMLGIPILGARLGGMTKAAAAILRASADLLRSKDWHVENSLQGPEKTAMEAFFRAGLLDRTYSHAVAGIGDSGVAYSAVRERVMQKMSFLFHHLERINRETTALAAYRMARDHGMEHAAAVTEAMMLTKKIHFDMSNSSRARALTSDAAKVMMVHRAHSLNMSIRMLRDVHQMFKGETKEARVEARRQFTGIIGMHALFAGVMGVPFYGIAMMVAGFAKDAFGDDDDDRTPEDVLKGWFYEAMPKEIADTILYGAPSTTTGLSLYNRIGFPDLFFRSAGREMEGRSEAEYWINQLIGPAFGMAAQMWDGLDKVRQGELWRGTEAMIPKGLRDVMRSTRYAREGVLTLNGDPVVDELHAWEMIGQASGFVPFVVSEAYEQRGAKMNLQVSIQRRKSQAMNMYALGFRQRDREIMQDAMKEVRRFNRAYPEAAITPASIKASMRQRRARAARNQTGGLVIEKRLETRIERELGY